MGRLPTGGLVNGNTVVNLIVPGELYGERVNQVDVRMAKVTAPRADARRRRL